MNKEFTYSNNEIIISTETGLKKTEVVDNIEEILTTQNNIEEMENIKEDIKKEEFFSYRHISDCITLKVFKKLFKITIPIAILITILIAVITDPYMALACSPLIISGLVLLTIMTMPAINLLETKIEKKILHKSDKILNEELEKEYKKLEQLNKVSKITNNQNPDIENKIVKINRTDLLKDLRRKLELIEDYQLNKNIYIKYYEKGLLSTYLINKNYSASDILFIQMLVEEDLKEKKKKSNKKFKNFKT